MSKDFIFEKTSVLKINLSSSFLARARCMKCDLPPADYWYVNTPPYWYDPKDSSFIFSWFKKYIKRLTGNWYLTHQPKHFISIKHFSFVYSERGYKPALHHRSNIEPYVGRRVEFLTCPCGSTVWAFSSQNIENHPEVKNRKSRHKYPHKFTSRW